MSQPFIRNHQFNLITKQVNLLQHACSTVSDPKVVESVRYGAQTKILEAFPDIGGEEKRLLEHVSVLKTTEEFKSYLVSLEPYRTEFGRVTEKQLKQLFPKNKKLKLPDLENLDFHRMTYLGWNDISTGKMFLAYRRDGQLLGLEGKFTPVNKKSVCFLCNRLEEVALFTANSKTKPANASPDYYKAVGNYLCVSSDTCNKNITDVAALERFLGDVFGEA